MAIGYQSQITLLNPTPAVSDFFGGSVSISGNNILVGARYDDTGATNAGSAYLFDATSGALLRTFNNPAPAIDDQFGYSVAISGNYVLVGASFDSTGATEAGSAYLFDATTGALLRTFNNPTPAVSDHFGHSVAISGNYVLVGASFDNTGATDAGSAYLFDATTGALLRTFNNPTPAISDLFGLSVSIDGTNVLVSAFRDNTGATDAGSAYLFDATTGALLRTFNNPTPAIDNQFGVSVAISGSNVVIGANRDNTGATEAGSAYLFDVTTGALLRTFNNPTPEVTDHFGLAVSILGNSVLVGAHRDNTGASQTGSVYLFDVTTGAIIDTINNPIPASGDSFGVSVAVSGSNVVVGAYLDDAGATDSGSVYLFLEGGTSDIAQGQVQIIGTCGLSFPNGSQVNYGPILPNTISSEIRLNMTNSGTVNATLTVKGDNWKDSENNSVMLVNKTHYNATSGQPYSSKALLQTFDQLVKNPFQPVVILQTFWQLQAILMNPSFTGSATQTMDFTVSC
jgi:hypothetical protein